MATRITTLPQIGDVRLYKRKGNRSLRLSIGLGGEVRVSLPYWLPFAAGEQFAISKAQWIALQRAKQDAPALEHGQSIGKSHRLYFEPTATVQKPTTRIKDGEIYVRYPFTHTSDDEAVQKVARKASMRALKSQAEALLPQRLKQLAAQTGFGYKEVQVKQLKSRWGSCTSAQEITLNIFLMQLPWHLIDYVLVHELTHTKIMRHGAPFWDEMQRHMPAAKQLRKEIGTHHPILAPSLMSSA